MKKNRLIGCADPHSLAEAIVGKSINWSKEKDEFDTLAKCFGITKEGFLSDESPIEAPYLAIDDNGQPYRLSDSEAEKRVSDFLKKYARPQPLNAKLNDKELSDSRKNVIDVLLGKSALSSAEEGSELTDPAKVQMNKKEFPEIIKLDTLKVNEEPGDGQVDPQNTGNYVWKEKGYFFNEVALWSDVCQNNIGDCYFLASLCSVAYAAPFKIKNATGLRYGASLSPWHEIQFYVPSTNDPDYAALQGKKNTVQTVVVSEDVLVSKNTNYNYGVCGPKEKQGNIPTSKADADSCWAAVYEKAFAKFLENTSSDKPNMKGKIDYGWPDLALKAILLSNKVKNVDLSKNTIDDIWNIACNAFYRPTCTTIYKRTKTVNGQKVEYAKAGTKSYYLNMGLYISHVYSLLGAITYNNKKYVVIRNPHGRNLSALKNNPKVYHNSWGFYYPTNGNGSSYNNTFDIYRTLSGNDDPQTSRGLFLMEIDEFKRVFDEITYYYGEI